MLVPVALPSVLDPKAMHVPEMSYDQAIELIHKTIQQISSIDPAAKEKFPCRPVSIVLYDPVGSSMTVDESMQLEPELTLMNLVVGLQSRLDFQIQGRGGDALLVKAIEIRVGTKDVTKGYPGINGEVIYNSMLSVGKSREEQEKEMGKVGEWILWTVGGSDMEHYWIAFRNMLQLGGDMVGKPILKVRTVKKVGDTGNIFLFGGHCFEDRRPVKGAAHMRVAQDIADATYGVEQSADAGGAWLNTAPAWEGRAAPDSDTVGQKFDSVLRRYHEANMRLEAAASSDVLPVLVLSPEPERAYDPRRTWGCFQRMGGDPRIHELINLDHLPFEVEDFKEKSVPSEPSLIRDIYPALFGIPKTGDENADSDSDTIIPANLTGDQPARLTERLPHREHAEELESKMVPYNPLPWPLTTPPASSTKAEYIQRAIEQREAAINFNADDDEIFYGDGNTKLQAPARVPSPIKKPHRFKQKGPSKLVNTERAVQKHIKNVVSHSPPSGMFNTESFKRFIANANASAGAKKGKSPEHQSYASMTSTPPFQFVRNSIVDADISGADTQFIQSTNIVTTLRADSPAFTCRTPLLSSSILNQSTRSLPQQRHAPNALSEPFPTLTADSPAFTFGSPYMNSRNINQSPHQSPRQFSQVRAAPPHNEQFPAFDFNFNGRDPTQNAGENFDFHAGGSVCNDG